MLDDLVQAGKIRFYGVSVERVEEALKAMEYPNVQSVQIIFNCFRQRPAELFFPQAKLKQVGILARVPLASGLLTGKFRADTKFGTDDHRNFNRRGQQFDVGETFSGVDYEVALAAVEETTSPGACRNEHERSSRSAGSSCSTRSPVPFPAASVPARYPTMRAPRSYRL